MPNENDELVDMAKLAEQAERYDDMVKYMKELTQKGEKLTDEQRNLLSVAFKNVVGARRSAWRIISSIEAKEKEKGDSTNLAEKYRQEIEKELQVRFTQSNKNRCFVCLLQPILQLVYCLAVANRLTLGS